MKTHDDLIQGSDEWLAFRAAHFPASEAPAMLGESPYKTRAQLLREKHTGMVPEVDAATHRRFDDGHRFEALARPLAEEIIGEPLSPVTGSDGMLSASFDGITFAGDVIFEHKSLNEEIRAAKCAADLGLHYRIQMEQQLAVSGAEKCLFMATKWNGNDELQEQVFHWYTPDMELRAKIIAGWDQFAQDLAEYQHVEHAPDATGSAPESLPSLRIEVTGMVTASNLAEFKAHAMTVFDGINTELQTDQDFANADKTAKWCKDVEDRLDAAKQHALSQTASIDELFRAIDHIKEEARQKRLHLEKLVKTRKESIRTELVMDAQRKLDDHTRKLNERIGGRYLQNVGNGFAEAIKGKKTISGCRDALNVALANAKIKASEIADTIEANRKSLTGDAHDWLFLFPDFAQVCAKAPEDFAALLAMRIGQHKEREEAGMIRAMQEAEAQVKAMQDRNAMVEQEKVIAPVAVLDPAAKQAAVIEHQDDISTFLKARSFKDESRIRAILCEFVKHQAERALASAA